MLWIRFDEEDRWSPAPIFCLNSMDKNQVCLHDFREDCNLVLIFVNEQGCGTCRDWLGSFASHRDDYLAEDAKVVAVCPEDVSDLRADPVLSALPITILSDPDGATRRSYRNLMDESLVSDEDQLIFVLDQYGAPYTAVVGTELDDPTLHEEILKWLRFVGLQCPE